MSAEATARPGPLAGIVAAWKLGISETVAYRASLVVWILTTSFPLVSLVLWGTLAADGPIGDYGQSDFVAYFVAAFLVRQLTSSWVCWDLSYQIQSGDLDTKLMRPLHPLLHFAMSNLSAIPLRAAFAAPVALVVLIVAGGGAWTLGPGLLLAPVALALAWLLVFTIQVAIGSLAFWWTRANSLYEVWITVFVALSGYMVPTSLFPAGVARVARVLPFHASMGFPVELVLGRLTPMEIAQGFALQLGWLALAMLAASVAWRRGLRAYGAVGS